jgi:hypothetical protein
MFAVLVVVATAIAVAIMVPSMVFVVPMESITVIVVVAPIGAVSVVIVSIVVAPVVEMAAVIVAARSVVAVIPRTRPDEHAVHKVIRSVIAVRGARIRIISVIAVSADWRWSHVTIHWANPNVDDYSLCMGIRTEKQANAQETQKP